MNIVRQAGQFGLRVWSKPYYGFLNQPTDREQKLIDDLRASFQALLPVTTGMESDAARRWAQFQIRLQHLVLTKDPREFLSWDVITRTMFSAFSPYARIELASLKKREDWNSRWKPALRESPVGRPARFVLYPSSSANLIHDAYNLLAFQEATGLVPEQFQTIVEFGGGYGSMCRLLFNLGFNGTYVIYDLPPFSKLQVYFLGSMGIPILTGDSRSQVGRGAILVSGDAEAIPSVAPIRTSKSLFIAAWSISETSIEVRRRFLSQVTECDAFLIAFQEQFSEMNNCQFFDRWEQETGATIEWTRIPIPQISGGHHYMFGTKKVNAIEAPATKSARSVA